MTSLKTTLSAVALAATMAAAAVTGAFAQSKGTVGIAMPTKSSARWIADGDNLVTSLKGMGYTTDLEYAEDKIPTQVSQVENMITKGAKLLIIANDSFPYMQQSGELVHAMLKDAGFNAVLEILPSPVMNDKIAKVDLAKLRRVVCRCVLTRLILGDPTPAGRLYELADRALLSHDELQSQIRHPFDEFEQRWQPS